MKLSFSKKKDVLILASASPRRKMLMRAAGFRFEIIPSHTSEKFKKGMPPRQIVSFLALKKAMSIAKKYPDRCVLGADTIVFINNHVVGKPDNAKHAKEILDELSGSWQKVYTGVAIVHITRGVKRVGVAVSSVKMRKLTEADIARASKKHLDKAGAYAVQEEKDPFVVKIVGDYDNVVGLPMRLVRKLLTS